MKRFGIFEKRNRGRQAAGGGSDVSDGYCANHERRVRESNAGVPVGLLVVMKVLGGGRKPLRGCWACALSENEFQGVLRESALLVERARAQGGTHTTERIALHLGEQTDGESRAED